MKNGKNTHTKKQKNWGESFEINRIYNEDCLKTMKRMPDKSIDMILQDPPYNMTKCNWDIEIDLSELWTQWLRIIKNKGIIVTTSSQPFTTKLIFSGIKYFKYELIWVKQVATGHLHAKRQPMKIHENVLIFSKESIKTYNPQMTNDRFVYRKATRINRTYNAAVETTIYLSNKRFPKSVFYIGHEKERFVSNNGNGNLHPTQKPVDLFRFLIRMFTNKDNVVYDGYLGSGTTAIACLKEDRNFIGSEISTEYYKKAEARINIEKSKIPLFGAG